MACRDLEKAEKAKAQIEAATKRPGVAEVWHLDLSSFDNIKEFTQRAAKLDRLDIMVNNAAYLAYYFQKAPNGHEVITMINYIGTFYLTVLMVPILRQSSVKFNIEPRIIIVSSDAVFFVRITRYSLGAYTNNSRRALNSVMKTISSPPSRQMPTITIGTTSPSSWASWLFAASPLPLINQINPMLPLMRSILASSQPRCSETCLGQQGSSLPVLQPSLQDHQNMLPGPSCTEPTQRILTGSIIRIVCSGGGLRSWRATRERN